jgi:phage baseplate assembly protein W
MTTVDQVKSTDWQMSANAFGEIVQGVNDVNQCLNFILTTQKFSDPLRPEFGVDLLSWIDKPLNDMAPGLVVEIIEQIGLYEQRINLSKVNYQFPVDQPGKVIFSLTWAYKGGYTTGLHGGDDPGDRNEVTTYFLLADQDGFVLVTDDFVSLILG